MRIIVRLGVLVVLVVSVFGAVSYSQPGIIPVSGWVENVSSTFKRLVVSHASSSAESVKVSKWVDAKGVTHYENRAVEGAEALMVDPNRNVLPPAPIVNLPETKSEQPKTMNDEVRELQKAKDAYYESIINN